VRAYLLCLSVAAAVTYLLTPAVRRLAVRVRAMTPVRDRDVHAIPTPRLGGVAMLVGFAAALLVGRELPLVQSVYEETEDPVALLSAAAIVCAVGAIDDKWGLDALTKFAGQTLAAGVMALQGIQLLWIPLPRIGTFVLPPELSTILTILVVVVMINAVNFVDGLDGLAAGVVAIGALAFFSYSYFFAVEGGYDRASTATLVTVVLGGMCLGFLPHNFSPARIFMGDSGAMLIGLLLAASTISLTGLLDPNAVGPSGFVAAFLPLILPFAVVALPFADLLLAIVRRTRAGRSPFSPDKQHLHHRLLEIGHSHARAVLIMYLWAALIAFGAVAMALLNSPVAVATLVAMALLLVLITVNVPRLGVRRVRS
jgi:UDP-GlcNAc:undecaprenyl-phosphate/decaprenyl-phosphate GlcNAc-1-phosphate transferase